MARLVGVSRILNEEELIEPFLRHHAALLDLHIVLDNGSTDRTLGILQALRAEGLEIQAFQAQSAVFAEPVFNTGLYRLALGAGADWVLFLDCDELIHVRGGRAGLEALLAQADPGAACLDVPLHNYARPPAASARHNPAESLAWREAEPWARKVFVRRLDSAAVSVHAGGHGVSVGGAAAAPAGQGGAILAHLPRRSRLQQAARVMLGRLKVLALGAPAAERNWSWHYAEPFEALKREPRAWLEREWSPEGALVHDPVAYAGGALRHTPEPDDLAFLLAALAAQAEALALSHGRLLDAVPALRETLLREAAAARTLI